MLLLLTGAGHVDGRMLRCDVAGSPFIDALSATLRRDPAVRAHVATPGQPLPPELVDAATSGGVLVADADVWFSPAAADALLHAAGPLRVTFGGDTLAVHLPAADAPAIAGRALPARAAEVALPAASMDVDASMIDEADAPVRVRNLADLAVCEAAILRGRAVDAALAGVRIRDLGSVRIRGELRCGEGVEIDANVIIQGKVVLGDGVKIGANCILTDAAIGDGCDIRPFTTVENASVGAGTFVGPYARLRPGAVIGERSQIGNFVEIKNSDVGPGSRINHMAFVGDATLGPRVTLGAATITCNHNGTTVARTVIGEGAYVGSGTMLVAPVEIGENAMVGAGSTISKDAPPGKLTLARAKQVTVPGWNPAGQEPK
ncbi:MAG TPA: hypothetical protein VFJ16_01185 [Longimicrobium sp.]|nr:hypothetical protein [Longimicrobium sp.]